MVQNEDSATVVGAVMAGEKMSPIGRSMRPPSCGFPALSSGLSSVTTSAVSSSSLSPSSAALAESLGVCSIPLTEISLPATVTLSQRLICDLEMLLMGAFDPLEGFLTKENYLSVCRHMRLTNGVVWPIPVVLPVPRSQIINGVSPHNENCAAAYDSRSAGAATYVMKLRDSFGTIVAELDVEDVYTPNLEWEMENVLGTSDPNHPYVQYMQKHLHDCVYIGGKVRPAHPILHFDFKELRKSGSEMREIIKAKGWEIVVGFQTRNPMHRSHFELTRQAMREATEETGKKAHLLLTPAVGQTQPGDVEYSIRVRCYKKILNRYGQESVHLALLPLAMRMAGPREALWHAIIRRNYGCTHFIVGRDHAGPSTRRRDGKPFYGPYDAHSLLKGVQQELGIKPIFGRNMLYIGKDRAAALCGPNVSEIERSGYMQADKVPEGTPSETISGSQFRDLLQRRLPVPDWFSFPEVINELQKFYRPKHHMGFCVYFTGLPCSGKSTLAIALEAAILENEYETRRVTVLDADIIRTHLSKGLGFSKEDRSLNVRRIGYVASEIVRHGGICLVANIAPYSEDRKFNRMLIESAGGGYVETYVSTPLSVCEERDVKELYKKARLGVVKCFTGISDPYEEPENSELVIDSSDDISGKVTKAINYLKGEQFIPTADTLMRHEF